MKSNILLYIIMILLIISCFFIKYYYSNINIEHTDTITVSDTIRKIDTLTIFKEKPIPKVVYLTKTDTFYTKNGDSVILNTENKVYQDTLCNKNDSIILKSYISGINSKIDSMQADWRKSETIITNTITIEKFIEKKKTLLDHFKFGVGAGYGIGLKNKDFEPFIGFTLNYTF